MSRLIHMLIGAVLGAALCLAVGGSIAAVVLLISLPFEYTVDRWHTAKWVVVISVAASTLVGSIAGAASRASEPGLPLLRSVMLVAITGIAVTLVFGFVCGSMGAIEKSAWFLIVPLAGVVFGGFVAASAGEKRSRRTRPMQPEQSESDKTH
jgi:hypothetical protein